LSSDALFTRPPAFGEGGAIQQTQTHAPSRPHYPPTRSGPGSCPCDTSDVAPPAGHGEGASPFTHSRNHICLRRTVLAGEQLHVGKHAPAYPTVQRRGAGMWWLVVHAHITSMLARVRHLSARAALGSLTGDIQHSAHAQRAPAARHGTGGAAGGNAGLRHLTEPQRRRGGDCVGHTSGVCRE
jgi:hypothetical protein